MARRRSRRALLDRRLESGFIYAVAFVVVIVVLLGILLGARWWGAGG
jgi:hypothetical protein